MLLNTEEGKYFKNMSWGNVNEVWFVEEIRKQIRQSGHLTLHCQIGIFELVPKIQSQSQQT